MLDRKVKPSEASVNERVVQMSKAKLELAELREIEKIRETAWWNIRVSRLEEKLENVNQSLNNFQTMTERDMLLHLAERLMLTTELNSIEDIDNRIAYLTERINVLQQEIDERREKLGRTTA